MSKQRGRFEAPEKVKIIREHLVDKQPLSEVCDQYGLPRPSFINGKNSFLNRVRRFFHRSRFLFVAFMSYCLQEPQEDQKLLLHHLKMDLPPQKPPKILGWL